MMRERLMAIFLRNRVARRWHDFTVSTGSAYEGRKKNNHQPFMLKCIGSIAFMIEDGEKG